MRRTRVLLPVTAVVLLVLVAVARVGPIANAQDGTPSADGFEIAPGVTAEALAFAAGREKPALYRLTFVPGVTYRVEPAPSISLVYGEVGALAITLDASITIVRAGATAAPGAAVAASTEFTLAAGDYAVFPPLVGGEVRNDGGQAAVVTVAEVVPGGMAAPTLATPAS